MKRIHVYAVLIVTLFSSLTLLSQHLPKGTYQANRERTFDLLHLSADLRVDWEDRAILGVATLRFAPLVSLSSVSFDAIGFEVSGVKSPQDASSVTYSVSDRMITIDLGRTLTPKDTVSVEITYTAHPSAGLYFVDPSKGTNGKPAIFTYGEGGIHANWLPLYNEPNDKFSCEMRITVERPHTAISNGRLVSTKENSDGTRTFHWSQKLPHSDYLLALFVGEYTPVELRKAFGEIPMSVWVHPGQEKVAAEVFARTPDMVEFFSKRFNFRYPWDKYDQISAFDYAIGAMENTGITGHNDRILRTGVFEEFNPDFTRYTENFSAEAIISHELAHHWFGNTTTYRNLSQLWLNESFASYLMMLWDEHRLGEDALRAYTTIALTDYLDYVATDHIIRPLEWHYFDTRGQIYNIQTTYQKGAIVLHQLRWVIGDEAFFKGLSYFMNKHQFSNVESRDLLIAFEESTGKNLEWYFNDWVWGGGHPVFDVSTNYIAATKMVEISVEQIQPFVKGQDLFTLPVEIRIDAGGKTSTHRVWVKQKSEHFSFPADTPPDMVSVDGRGFLVADIRSEKDVDELIWQLSNDAIPGKIRALRQMIAGHASDPTVIKAISKMLLGTEHWYVKAEAAFLLGSVPSQAAEQILIDQTRSKDYHVRKAAVVALGSHATATSRTALRAIMNKGTVDEVAATAIVSLTKIDPSLGLDFFRTQLTTPSWYDVRTLAALTAMEIAAKPEFVATVKEYASTQYNYAIRTQALKTWAACAPLDEELREKVLPFIVKNDILDVRTTAMSILATLKVTEALPILRELAEKNGDMDIRFAAKEAIEEIER